LNNSDSSRKDISTELAMGGQALMEGVMMRSPHRVAMAARLADGGIAVRAYPYRPVTRKYKLLGLPVVRGAVGMVEALKIGIDALNWSAAKSDPELEKKDDKPASAKEKAGSFLMILLSVAIGLGVFFYLPYWIAKFAVGGEEKQLPYHLVAGSVRIAVLVGYMAVISYFKEIFRVFQYHGSEHKTIFAYEQKQKLEPSQVSKMTRFHPRCGTSFLLIVAISAILFFVVVDSAVVAIWGPYKNVLTRLLVHLPLIPLVAGISFEFLKFSARHTGNLIVNALIQPGLWLQRITTKEPEPAMCEVAICALEEAMRDPSDAIELDTVYPAGSPPLASARSQAAA
jgi:uncharacterized protein YqhQ